MGVIYVGIGARKTPDAVLLKMRNAAKAMATMGFTLRSGGAAGADEAFEQGCDAGGGKKEIFLPYKGFRKNPSSTFGSTREARLIAKEFHPNWANVSCVGRDFHARNSYQILGLQLNRAADFVLCYTPNGKKVGGTAQAIRMAEHFKIPVLNFGDTSDDDISNFIFAIDERINRCTKS